MPFAIVRAFFVAHEAPPPRSGRRWLRRAASKSEGAPLASNSAKTWASSAFDRYAIMPPQSRLRLDSSPDFIGGAASPAFSDKP